MESQPRPMTYSLYLTTLSLPYLITSYWNCTAYETDQNMHRLKLNLQQTRHTRFVEVLTQFYSLWVASAYSLRRYIRCSIAINRLFKSALGRSQHAATRICLLALHGPPKRIILRRVPVPAWVSLQLRPPESSGIRYVAMCTPSMRRHTNFLVTSRFPLLEHSYWVKMANGHHSSRISC